MSLSTAFPLLKQVDNLGVKLGQFVPDITRGSIVLNNEAGSLGSERRFSDLLEHYTLIDQELIVEVASLPLGNDNFDDVDFSEVWRAIATDVQWNSTECRINVSRSTIPIRTMTKTVTSDVFSTAPENSLGRQLPIVFTDSTNLVDVEPVQVSAMYTTSSENRLDFAYATTLASKFVVGGILSAGAVQMENQEGNYQDIVPMATATTPILSFPLQAAGGSTIGSYADPPELLREIAFKLQAGQNVTAGQVIAGVDWYMMGASTTLTTDEFNFQCKIYSSANGFPENVLASDTIDETTTTKITLGSAIGDLPRSHKLRFTLNRPVIIPEGGEVFVSITRSDPTEFFAIVRWDGNGGSLTAYEKYVKIDADDAREWAREIKTDARETVEVFGLAISETTTGGSSSLYENGLGHATFTVKMRDQSNIPDLTQLKLLARTQGLLDDSSGTISGTPSSKLYRADWQTRMLLHQWSGSAWTESIFDATKFASTHSTAFASGRWNFKTIGATQGRVTVRDILIDIMRNSGAKIVPIVTGGAETLALWAWGGTETIAATIDDEHARLIKAEIGGIETVVNYFQAAYNRSIKGKIESLLADGSLPRYRGLLDSNTATGLDAPSDKIALSKTNWGTRPLANINYDWLADETSAKSLAAFNLRNHNEPKMLVTIAVPINKYSLELTNVCTLKLVNLPAFYGSSHDARLPLADTEQNSLDLINGHYWKRGQSYRSQLIANELQLQQGGELSRLLIFEVLPSIAIT